MASSLECLGLGVEDEDGFVALLQAVGPRARSFGRVGGVELLRSAQAGVPGGGGEAAPDIVDPARSLRSLTGTAPQIGGTPYESKIRTEQHSDCPLVAQGDGQVGKRGVAPHMPPGPSPRVPLLDFWFLEYGEIT
jgi:hypothetical protein